MSARQKQVIIRETVDFIKQRIAHRRGTGGAENQPVRFVPVRVDRPAAPPVERENNISVRLPNGVVVEARGNLDLADLLTAAAAL